MKTPTPDVTNVTKMANNHSNQIAANHTRN